MTNSIVVKIPFDFKGESFEPKAVLDLDDWARRNEEDWSAAIVRTVAHENGIGVYSYELEVMEVSEMLFESPTGLAQSFYLPQTQGFDFDGFQKQWHSDRVFAVLEQIAQTHLQQPLEADSALHKALMAAFSAGQTPSFATAGRRHSNSL